MDVGLPSIYFLRQVISLGAGSVVKQSAREKQGSPNSSRSAELAAESHKELWPVAKSI